jgi:hypothetical protein
MVYDALCFAKEYGNDVEPCAAEIRIVDAQELGGCAEKMPPLRVVHRFFRSAEHRRGARLHFDKDEGFAVQCDDVHFGSAVARAPVARHDPVPASLQEPVSKIFAAPPPGVRLIFVPQPGAMS